MRVLNVIATNKAGFATNEAAYEFLLFRFLILVTYGLKKLWRQNTRDGVFINISSASLGHTNVGRQQEKYELAGRFPWIRTKGLEEVAALPQHQTGSNPLHSWFSHRVRLCSSTRRRQMMRRRLAPAQRENFFGGVQLFRPTPRNWYSL